MKLATALLLVFTIFACSSVRYEWEEEPAEGSFEPLSEDAPVTIWISSSPVGAYGLVAAADNPMIGTGPPGAIQIGSGKLVFEGSLDIAWSRVVEKGTREARRLGGDILVLGRRKVEDPDPNEHRYGAWEFLIKRSRP